jgi:hypothetical protein
MYLFLPQAQDPCSDSMTSVNNGLEVISGGSRKMELLWKEFSKQSLLPGVAREYIITFTFFGIANRGFLWRPAASGQQLQPAWRIFDTPNSLSRVQEYIGVLN